MLMIQERGMLERMATVHILATNYLLGLAAPKAKAELIF